MFRSGGILRTISISWALASAEYVLELYSEHVWVEIPTVVVLDTPILHRIVGFVDFACRPEF
jgi:hypothetical protein